MVKIHVIGAGLSGLAAAYFCQQLLPYSVYLYDKGDKKGASFVGSGLVHPFAGPKGLLSQRGFEAMQASTDLIEVAQQALLKEKATERKNSFEQIVLSHSLYRVASNGFQKTMFSRWHKRLPHLVKKLDKSALSKHSYFTEDSQVYEIACACSVNIPCYLKGLKKAFESKGGTYIEQRVDKESFAKDDVVIYAVGRDLLHFPALADLNIYLSKGQLLIADQPHSLKVRKPIVAKGYLSKGPNESIVLGATYEKQFDFDEPDREFAISEIVSKMEKFIHIKEPLRIREVRSGIRVVNQEYYFPIAKKISKREYVVTAMGSRGLLYHAMLGRYIAELIGCDKGAVV